MIMELLPRILLILSQTKFSWTDQKYAVNYPIPYIIIAISIYIICTEYTTIVLTTASAQFHPFLRST